MVMMVIMIMMIMIIIINEDNDDDEEPASFAKELKLVQITSYYVRAVPEVHVHVPSVISDALARKCGFMQNESESSFTSLTFGQ